MAKQSVLWTALPNGYTADGGGLRISALASPRLEPEGSPQELATFVDFIDWPATLAQSTFLIRCGAQSVTAAIGGGGDAQVDGTLGLPESGLWAALLPKTTYVRPHAFKDLSTNLVLSYDTRHLDTIVKTLYAQIAKKAGDELPKISVVAGDPEWKKVIGAVARIDRASTNEKTSLREPQRQFNAFFENGLANKDKIEETLARFQLFHTPAATPEVQKYNVPAGDPKAKAKWRTFRRGKFPVAADFEKAIDFHQVVAAMNQYPTLLRRLGLVIDFVVPAKLFAHASDALLWVEAALPTAASPVVRLKDASPRTHVRHAAGVFVALPRPAPQPGDYRTAGGLLDLDPKQFALLQADVDGDGLKVLNFARSLMRMSPDAVRFDEVTRREREVGTPALRNAGLMLVHTGRSSMLKNSFTRNKARNDAVKAIQGGGAAPPAEFHAEDLVRGYRIDVWDGREAGTTGEWRSLCLRNATYVAGAGAATVNVAGEEGTVRLAATKSADEGSNPDLIYLHEALTSWTGWSLTAPPPGQVIDKDDQSGPADAEVPPGIRLQTSFRAVPGSLPRLRYGRKYWLRARVVDLAGNSLPPQPKDFGPENPVQRAVRYMRYEPIGAPALALAKKPGQAIEGPAEGESMERLAIRSFNATPADNVIPTGQQARRYVVPVRQTARDAEHHGALDALGKVDAGTFAMLAAKDDPLQSITLQTAGPLAQPVDTVYAFFQNGDTLPYLPDPLATEIAARVLDLPGWDPAKVIPIPLYASGAKWPHASPFVVRVIDKPGASPEWNALARELVVPLPKAIRARLRLSVKPTKPALALMGVWGWLSVPEQATLEPRALDGQHWMLTPWRTVELVHAVQKPLITPQFMKHAMYRALGETRAAPTFVSTCSIKSTDRFDLQAEWHEPTDDPAQTGPGDLAKADHAYSIKITDPKHYASRLEEPVGGGTPDHRILAEDVIECGGIAHDRVRAKRHELNDTRYRRIEYWFEATTRFREYMPASLLTEDGQPGSPPIEDNIEVIGARLRTWVPSSAPPPAPDVLYVVPTFGWLRAEQSTGTRTSWRRGGGLRVYLDRPWNASGYGEMLAVVVPPAAFAGDPNTQPAAKPMKNLVTQWGNDPSWLSAYVAGAAPKRTAFPLSRTAPDPAGAWLPPGAPAPEADQPPGAFRVADLAHPALASSESAPLVDIAPHDVFYDPVRRLWYCDIEVNQGSSYSPFIRLALARYQPVSLERAHLSNVVLADFMQLTADRWLSIAPPAANGTRRVTLSGYRPTDSSGALEARTSPSMSLRIPGQPPVTLTPAPVAKTTVVEVWVERLNAARGEDFGWARDATAKVVLVRTTAPARTTTRATAAMRTRATELLRLGQHDTLVAEGLLDVFPITPTIWDGTVALPAGVPAATRHRLVIAEYEEYLVDDDRPYDPVPTKKDSRLVYVEHVELKA
jgi:hypothetical protein